MTNENLIAILDVIKGLKEDVFQKIDELKEDVEEKINKLCSDQERNRDELVRLNTHMIYVQSSIADIKQDTSTQVSQAKDLVIALEHKIEKSLEQESCARKRALEEQQENMGRHFQILHKIQNPPL